MIAAIVILVVIAATLLHLFALDRRDKNPRPTYRELCRRAAGLQYMAHHLYSQVPAGQYVRVLVAPTGDFGDTSSPQYRVAIRLGGKTKSFTGSHWGAMHFIHDIGVEDLNVPKVPAAVSRSWSR